MNQRKWVFVVFLTCGSVGGFSDPFVTDVLRSGCGYRHIANLSHSSKSPLKSITTALHGMFDRNEDLLGADRLKACVPYLLPLIDGDSFGAYIYDRIPLLGFLDDITIGPLSNLARNIPFFSVLLFIGLTLGTRFNLDMNRNVRFSAQQAALIDVALLLPELIASGFQDESLPRTLVEPCCNFVWYTYMSAVVYCVYSNLRGNRPDKIPYISAFADELVGPI
jgi:Chloroplast import apparatus Tic20-like